MSQFRVTLLVCLVAAFFLDSNAQKNGLDDIHQDLALQLFEKEHVGATGEYLAGKLQDNLQEGEAVDEIHAELASQLLEEEHTRLRGEELASKLHEGRRYLNEMDREIVQQLLEEELASLSEPELARMLGKDRTNSLQTRDVGCIVQGLGAKCCAGTSFKVLFKRIELSVCVQVILSPESARLALKITAFNITLFEKTISACKADGICVSVPVLRVLSVCLSVSRVEVSRGYFKGCFDMRPKVFGQTITSLYLGCITIPKTHDRN